MSKLYNILWYFFTPLVYPWLLWRLYCKKEERSRLKERFGIATIDRPNQPIIWLHGVSVGEVISLSPLISFFKQKYPHCKILVTTGTTTAAKIIIQREQGDIIHQYIPLDNPVWTKRFFEHWKPCLGIVVESEFWPNLIATSTCPMWLLSARLTFTSYQRWKKWASKFFAELMQHFSLIFAQTEADVQRLKKFYKDNIFISNLKYLADQLPTNLATINALKKLIGDRPFLVAASTHPGEEKTIIQAHQLIKLEVPSILTIIIPRHPLRGGEIKGLLPPSILSTQRSTCEKTTAKTDVYIGDTLGELGNFFSISPITFIGGSLLPGIGGHNLLEPASFENTILHGPYMHKSLDMYELFTKNNTSFVVKDDIEIANCVILLLKQKKKLQQHQAATKKIMDQLQKDKMAFWEKIKESLTDILS